MNKDSIFKNVRGAFLGLALSGCGDGTPKEDGVTVMKALAQKNPEKFVGRYLTLSGEEGKPDKGVVYIRNVFREEGVVCGKYRFFSSNSKESDQSTESYTKQACILDNNSKPQVGEP